INNFESFYGYDFISLSGNSFVKGVLTLDYEIFKKNHINIAANFSNIADNIFDDGEWFTSPDYSGYAIGYALETFIGPIELKYTYSPETKKSIWFFNLGFWFRSEERREGKSVDVGGRVDIKKKKERKRVMERRERNIKES